MWVGEKVDAVARKRLKAWLLKQGVSEGRDGTVQVNRWLRNPAKPKKYRIPDVRIGELVLDGTIGRKSIFTPQVRDYFKFGANRVIIIRPNPMQSHLIVPPR